MFDPPPVKFDPTLINQLAVRFDEAGEHDELGTYVKDFYDRVETKGQIISHLRSPNRAPVVLIGARRSGKTSVLRLISDRLSYFSEGFASVLLLHQEINSRNRLAENILGSVRSEVIRLNPRARFDFDARARLTVTTRFLDELGFLLKQIPGRTLVICIDEIDSIAKAAASNPAGRAADEPAAAGSDFGSEVIELVRALMDSALNVRLLVSMSRIDYSKSYLADFCARAQLIYLPAFEAEDCLELAGDLLGQSFGASGAELERLCQLSGGWPYFIKLILSHVKETPPDPGWLDKALDRAVESEGAGLSIREMYKKDFDRSDKTVVLLLTKHDRPVTRADVEAANPSLQKAEIEKSLRNLSDRNFIVGAGDGYGFRPGFLKHWFKSWSEVDEEMALHLNPEPWRGPDGEGGVFVTDEDLKDWDIF